MSRTRGGRERLEAPLLDKTALSYRVPDERASRAGNSLLVGQGRLIKASLTPSGATGRGTLMEFYGRIYIHLRASDCKSRRLYGSWRNSARRKPDRINSSNSDVPGAAAVRSIIIKAAKTRSLPLPLQEGDTALKGRLLIPPARPRN